MIVNQIELIEDKWPSSGFEITKPAVLTLEKIRHAKFKIRDMYESKDLMNLTDLLELLYHAKFINHDFKPRSAIAHRLRSYGFLDRTNLVPREIYLALLEIEELRNLGLNEFVNNFDPCGILFN